ncbi:MAG TPA: c-type cytochrome domain-containing protein, partial [Verrucomicrobiae bacterium]|nr:c-type cytochrome domain-containing protein [Verrucomicrobiae bacterium]
MQADSKSSFPRRSGPAWLASVAALTVVVSVLEAAGAGELPPPAARKVDYAKDIEPIFSAHCYDCHGPKKRESALHLDTRTGAMKGGESYGDKAIIPGDSAQSVLVQAVTHTHSELKMPKKGERLTAEEVGLLRAWIDQGAEWGTSATAVAKKDPSQHWAFKAPSRPAVP